MCCAVYNCAHGWLLLLGQNSGRTRSWHLQALRHGEVYRARDARLNRDVAIKVLPAAFVRDPDRLRRFQQEAQAVAALNHPNSLAIHDFGEHEGSPCIVTESLEGETLRERPFETAPDLLSH
jgi:serine/threonine protein kinase